MMNWEIMPYIVDHVWDVNVSLFREVGILVQREGDISFASPCNSGFLRPADLLLPRLV